MPARQCLRSNACSVSRSDIFRLRGFDLGVFRSTLCAGAMVVCRVVLNDENCKRPAMFAAGILALRHAVRMSKS